MHDQRSRGGSHRRRPGHATVVAYLALFIALSGGAWAAATIGAADIERNAVRAKHMKKNSVRAKHIKRNQVGAPKLKPNSVGSAKIRPQAVGAEEVRDRSLTGPEVADDSLTGLQIDELTLDPAVIQRRIAGDCGPGSALAEVDEDGEATCRSFVNGSASVLDSGRVNVSPGTTQVLISASALIVRARCDQVGERAEVEISSAGQYVYGANSGRLGFNGAIQSGGTTVTVGAADFAGNEVDSGTFFADTSATGNNLHLAGSFMALGQCTFWATAISAPD